MRSGAPVTTPVSAAIAVSRAQHATAVNVTVPQPDRCIANTDVTTAAIAASKTWAKPGLPGTARKPVTAPNVVAITPKVIPATGSR